MKELADPVAGNLFYVRDDPVIYGRIESVFVEYGETKIALHWIQRDGGEREYYFFEDLAYPPREFDNFYVYLDIEDTPKNRLAFQLKYPHG